MSGKINFYYGVVGSRKSSELLLTAHRNKSVGKKLRFFSLIKITETGMLYQAELWSTLFLLL